MSNEIREIHREPRQESPLVGLSHKLSTLPAADVRFQFSEQPFLELVNLRGDAGLNPLAHAVESLAGCTLPVRPNTVTEGPAYRILWLGPDEWLIQSKTPRRPSLERALRALLKGVHASVVDVSSGYTMFVLAGTNARDVLQKGCPLDFHPHMFVPGQCAQSHFFKADVLLRPASQDGFDMLVRRSFADYCCRILLDAAEEFLS